MTSGNQIRRFFKDLKYRAKSAIFIALAFIGLTFLVSGITDILPNADNAFYKILAGTIIVLVVGYMGYGILGKKHRGN